MEETSEISHEGYITHLKNKQNPPTNKSKKNKAKKPETTNFGHFLTKLLRIFNASKR